MNNSKVKKNLGRYLPNYITFLSLGFGLISIVLSAQEYILWAGLCIVISSILDSLDGYFARKLGLESAFGLHLDSLADIVGFGVAPLLLISQYLQGQNRFVFWLLPIFLIFLWAGAFRLARFNLQLPKENSGGSSLGLSISAAGLILALMILSDISLVNYSYPVWMMLFLVCILSFLMASRVVFPPFSWFVPHPAIYGGYLIVVVILTIGFSIFTAAWFFWLGILAASVIRYLIQDMRKEKVIL